MEPPVNGVYGRNAGPGFVVNFFLELFQIAQHANELS